MDKNLRISYTKYFMAATFCQQPQFRMGEDQIMCHVFAGQDPESYACETRRLRLNGQSTSIRLERGFWVILDRIAAGEGVSTPHFISTLHSEVLELRGEPANFTSLLRCACLKFLQMSPVESPLAIAAE